MDLCDAAVLLVGSSNSVAQLHLDALSKVLEPLGSHASSFVVSDNADVRALVLLPEVLRSFVALGLISATATPAERPSFLPPSVRFRALAPAQPMTPAAAVVARRWRIREGARLQWHNCSRGSCNCSRCCGRNARIPQT